jgi:hypothetical protein
LIQFDSTKTRLYESFIRDVVNSIVQKIDFEKLNAEGKLFLTKVKERFCFDNDNSWKFLISSLDAIGDSQFAITTFLNHKIENGNKFNTGENYLRLYGVLSAVYIQQQAILKLFDLFKAGEVEKLKDDFGGLEITFLRHCISAHPINFNKNGSKVSFKIDRNSLNDDGLLSIRDESNNSKTHNIYSSLNDYIFQAENYLEIICRELISNCYKTAKEKHNELNNKLELIKKSK